MLIKIILNTITNQEIEIEFSNKLLSKKQFSFFFDGVNIEVLLCIEVNKSAVKAKFII